MKNLLLPINLIDLKDKCLELIDHHYEYASSLSIALIRSEARKILKQRPELDEFIMAMGTFFFTSKEQINSSPNNVIPEDQLNEPEFYEMVWQLNEKFNCTGYPMRFTADGKEIND